MTSAENDKFFQNKSAPVPQIRIHEQFGSAQAAGKAIPNLFQNSRI